MKRRNGKPIEIRRSAPDLSRNHRGRQCCLTCNRLVPRGSDRPFCLDHAEYAQQVMRELALLEAGDPKRAA